MTYYTYLWLRENGTPYYVGKGSGKRAWRHRSPVKERVLIEYFPSEEEALNAEVFLINYYGRKLDGGVLRNLSEGGDKPPVNTEPNSTSFKSGHVPAHKGKGYSAEERRVRRKIANEKYRRKIGVRPWEEFRETMKVNPPHKGHKHTEETKEKIRAKTIEQHKLHTAHGDNK